MYDPSTARFLSKDPLEELGGSPNLYLYCANDPVNKTDPSGNTSTQDKILGVLGIDPASVQKLRACNFKWPEFSCWRTNWDLVKGCGALLEKYTFSQFKLESLKKDPKPLVWVLADVTHIDPKLLEALAGLFGNFNRDGLSRVALAFLGYESWDDILGEFLAHAGTDHVADLVQLINLLAVGQNGRPALLDLDVGAGFVRLFELFTRDPEVLNELAAQLPEALKEFQKAAGEEILEHTLGAVLSALLQGGIAAIPIIGPLFKLIQYVLNNAGSLCDLAHKGSEFLQGLVDTGRAGDQFGTQCADLLPKLHALVRKLFAAVISSVLSVLGVQRAVTRLGEVLRGLQKVARKPFEVILRMLAKLARKIADANRLRVLGPHRDPMAPEPLSPDAGVFSDPDVEAGTGEWHVWVGENSDDLWVRVNPTANLSAKVRASESGKACNAPAKAEVRSGANGLKAVKIGRGQRFTRGQAKQIPSDNHKVVAGSKRAAQEELGCVPKCRKCAVLPPTATCKVKGAGQCFVGATPVRWSGASGFALKALAEVELGERVETFRSSDGSWWEPGGRRLFASSQDRAVWLRQERGDGGWTAVGLIRSRIWLEKQGASRVGARVELKLSEMGASGPFEVVSVEPCPAIGVGGGCVVTGVFCHGAGRVYDLWLEGESGPLGVTAGHPIWSADRGAWVPAGALQEGECVQGVNGRVRVLRLEERGDAPVFTLEVDGDHCYRVGEQGVLVHNASCGTTGAASFKSTQSKHYVSWYMDGKVPVSRVDKVVFTVAKLEPERTNLVTPPWWTDFMSYFKLPRNASSDADWNQGHGIASQFGGPDSAGNFLPQHQIVNISPYKTCENRVADEIRDVIQPCKSSCVRITVIIDYGKPAVEAAGTEKRGSVFPLVFYYSAVGLDYPKDESFEINNATIENSFKPRPGIPPECKK
jgi:hypothetical protein